LDACRANCRQSRIPAAPVRVDDLEEASHVASAERMPTSASCRRQAFCPVCVGSFLPSSMASLV